MGAIYGAADLAGNAYLITITIYYKTNVYITRRPIQKKELHTYIIKIRIYKYTRDPSASIDAPLAWQLQGNYFAIGQKEVEVQLSVRRRAANRR